MVLVATVLALAVALPADASIPPLETRPSLAALAAQATAEQPAPTTSDAPFRLFKIAYYPLAGAASSRFHVFPEAKTRIRGLDLEIAPRVRLRRFQVPECTRFALFGGGESCRRARITEYAWLRDGRLSEVAYPNGTRARHGYDAVGRTESITSTQGAAPVSSFTYTYDLNGNRRAQVETRGADAAETTTYAYDPADRLLEVAYPDSTVTYTYDPVGNRLSEGEADGTGTLLSDKTYVYDSRDRLLSLTDALDPDGAVAFTYDPAGNRRSSTPAVGDPKTYLYDARNRLVEVREAGLLLESYRYDHRGLRIRRAGPEGVVHAVYDDTSLLVETDPFGNTLRKYDYGPDRLLSLAESTGERRFYLFDALGSVTDLVSPAGAVEARYVYDAWGNLRRDLGASENSFAFTGHRLDRPTGLYYAKARYYDPELGLFLTEDPFAGEAQNPPSLHRYLYAYQNPTVWVDPTGEINVLRDAQEDVRRKRDEIADEVESDEEVSGAAVKMAALNLLDKGLGLLNAGANVVIGTAAPDSELGQEARAEIDQAVEDTAEAARETVEQVVEDPIGVGTTISMTPQELMKDGLRTGVLAVGAKDPKTRAESQAAVLEVGAEVVVGAGVLSRGKKAAEVIDEVAGARPRRTPGAGSGVRWAVEDVPQKTTNPILEKPRVGSALKSDPHHAFPNLIDNFASDAQRFTIPTRGPGGKVVRQSELLQVEGSLSGRQGVFEWIIDQEQVTHRRFIPGGRVTGSPNQIPGKN